MIRMTAVVALGATLLACTPSFADFGDRVAARRQARQEVRTILRDHITQVRPLHEQIAAEFEQVLVDAKGVLTPEQLANLQALRDELRAALESAAAQIQALAPADRTRDAVRAIVQAEVDAALAAAQVPLNLSDAQIAEIQRLAAELRVDVEAILTQIAAVRADTRARIEAALGR